MIYCLGLPKFREEDFTPPVGAYRIYDPPKEVYRLHLKDKDAELIRLKAFRDGLTLSEILDDAIEQYLRHADIEISEKERIDLTNEIREAEFSSHFHAWLESLHDELFWEICRRNIKVTP